MEQINEGLSITEALRALNEQENLTDSIKTTNIGDIVVKYPEWWDEEYSEVKGGPLGWIADMLNGSYADDLKNVKEIDCSNQDDSDDDYFYIDGFKAFYVVSPERLEIDDYFEFKKAHEDK